MAGSAYRDVAARRSVTEILKHFFPYFLVVVVVVFAIDCRPFCWRFWRQIFRFLQSFFATAVVVVVVNLLPEKSRREIYATKRCQ